MVRYLSPEGFEKLKKELERLEVAGRREMANRINHAASFGDLSENAAYSEAKEAQGFLEGRIAELKEILSQAKIIKKEDKEEVQIGSTVIVKLKKEEMKFQIVGREEVDIAKGKISYQSPLGESFMGKKKGDIVNFNVPDGKNIEYEIIDIN